MSSLGQIPSLSREDNYLKIGTEQLGSSEASIDKTIQRFIASILDVLKVTPTKSCTFFQKSSKIHDIQSARDVNIERLSTELIKDLNSILRQQELEKPRAVANVLPSSTFEDIPISMSVTTATGKFLDCSQSYSRMFGYSKEELLNKTEQILMNPKQVHDAKRTMYQLPSGSFVEQFQVMVKRKDGTQFWAEVNKSNIKDEHGNIIKIFTQIQDISKVKATQESLKQKVKELSKDLDEAQLMMNRLLMTANHETRNALNIIIPSAEKLKEGRLASDEMDLTNSIYDSSKYLLDVINSDSDYRDLSLNRMTLNNMPFSLSKFLTDLHLIFSKKMPPEINFCFSIAENVPTVVWGDEKRIFQMLGKLISNAIQFTQAGNISVRVDKLNQELGEESSGSNESCILKFTVTDTGAGVHQDVIPRLFKPFEKGINSVLGVGLGLSITKALAELMGGGVDPVISPLTIEGGSSFSFCIPVKKGKVSDLGPVRDLELENAIQSLRNKKVLIVDDAPMNRKMLAKFLEGKPEEGRNVTVVYAEDGAIALKKLKEDPTFDIVFMDCQMPVMDGYTAIEEIRKLEQFKTLPIISLTGDSAEIAEERCFKAGTNAFFSKPFGSRELFLKVHQLIGP